jgi:hypothetical protein
MGVVGGKENGMVMLHSLAMRRTFRRLEKRVPRLLCAGGPGTTAIMANGDFFGDRGTKR